MGKKKHGSDEEVVEQIEMLLAEKAAIQARRAREWILTKDPALRKLSEGERQLSSKIAGLRKVLFLRSYHEKHPRSKQ